MNTLEILPARVGDTLHPVFDFADVMAFGETLNPATIAVALYSGSGALPVVILSSITGTTVTVVVPLSNSNMAGCQYTLTCTATLSGGQVLKKVASLAVLPA